MSKSLELLIQHKEDIIALARQYGIDMLKYSPIVFPEEKERVILLAERNQVTHTLADFQYDLEDKFNILANVFSPDGIHEAFVRHQGDKQEDFIRAEYQPVIDTAFPLSQINQENAKQQVVKTPEYDVSDLVARYRKRMRTAEERDMTSSHQLQQLKSQVDTTLTPVFANIVARSRGIDAKQVDFLVLQCAKQNGLLQTVDLPQPQSQPQPVST